MHKNVLHAVLVILCSCSHCCVIKLKLIHCSKLEQSNIIVKLGNVLIPYVKVQLEEKSNFKVELGVKKFSWKVGKQERGCLYQQIYYEPQ